jgi:HD-like signal output (HDOD) protein
VASLVSGGLEPLPDCVFDLDVLLSEPVVDLKKVAGALGSERELAERVLRLSNASVVQPSDLARNIPDAVVLLGPGMFHAAVLVSAVSEFGPPEFRNENAEAIWTHSVLMAALSEKIAELSEYPIRGMAFVAGLLHDIGHLPFLTVAREERTLREGPSSVSWRDNIELEREIFGLDHCELGRWMGMSWKFSPILMDAVQHHHDPRKAAEDPHLAEVVCAAEHFCSGAFASADRERECESISDGVEFMGERRSWGKVHNRLNPGSQPSFVWATLAGEQRRPAKRFRN